MRTNSRMQIILRLGHIVCTEALCYIKAQGPLYSAGTVARSQKRLSANLTKKFGQTGKNSAFLQNLGFTAKMISKHKQVIY
jgi:hypothetical protein